MKNAANVGAVGLWLKCIASPSRCRNARWRTCGASCLLLHIFFSCLTFAK